MHFPIKPLVDFNPLSIWHWLLIAVMFLGGLYMIYVAGRLLLDPKARKPPFQDLAALPIQDLIFFFVTWGAILTSGVVPIGIAMAKIWSVPGRIWP